MRLVPVVLAASLLALLCTRTSAAPTVPSAKDLTRAAAIEDVSVSPDGKHIVALTSTDGVNKFISVWSTDKLGEKPFNIDTPGVRVLSVSFIKSDRLFVTAVKPFDFPDAFQRRNPRGHLVKRFVTDLEGRATSQLLPNHDLGNSEETTAINHILDPELISSLPMDPRKVLVEDDRFGGDGALYDVDVYTMTPEKVLTGSDRYSGYQVDLKGQVRARLNEDFDNGKVYLAQQLRDPVTGAWQEYFRSYAKDRDVTSIISFTDDPNVVLVTAAQGSDKAGVYEYDAKQKKILEPAFEHRLFDATGGVIESHAPADYGRPLGFGYAAETAKIYWVDGQMGAIDAAVRKALGLTTTPVDWIDPGSGAHATIDVAKDADVSLVSASFDRKYMIFEKSGPRQPPQYYLLTDGAKLTALGKSRPWIDPAALGETRLVEYAARDGLEIPAFLTTPSKALFGPGPYPTLIEPHGGPWGRDEMEWDISGWIQYFASRGYAVLQPQFRGSEGWGQKLWRAGDAEWGQKMQDDLDDGVKWMIDQHIASPRRVAIFGYSYGGYAALAASIRPNGLYQCAISGAGAGDLLQLADDTYDNRFGREFQHPTIAGLNPADHISEVKIPVMLYHGDRDGTVDPDASRRFASGLAAAGKPYKYVEIKDMGHQYVFMTPAMMEQQLNEVDSFLKTGCKPGGL